MYYIGIDLGTSAVKLLLMEGNRENRKSYLKGSIRYTSRIGLVAAKPGRLVQAVHGRAL